jgi:hypothetical protein
MAQIANIEYLWRKCNAIFGTNYSYDSKQAINVEYVLKTANIIDNAILQTEPDFTKDLSNNSNLTTQAADKDFVNIVLNCVNSCARSCHSCTGTCNNACNNTCTGSCSGTCSGGCTNGCYGICSGTCGGTCSGSCAGMTVNY